MSQSPVSGSDKPIEELERGELERQLDQWRNIWTWVPDEVRYYLSMVGENVRLMARNYVPHFGVLLQPKFKLESLEIRCVEVTREPFVDRQYVEDKVMVFPIGQLTHFERVIEREEVEQEEQVSTDSYPTVIRDELEVSHGAYTENA